MLPTGMMYNSGTLMGCHGLRQAPHHGPLNLGSQYATSTVYADMRSNLMTSWLSIQALFFQIRTNVGTNGRSCCCCKPQGC